MTPFDFTLRTRVIFGEGAAARVGDLARELGGRRPLVVSDPGIGQAGHVEPALAALRAAGLHPRLFDGFGANPDTAMVEAGRALAAAHGVDLIVGLGGGSSLDCAKGINFVLTNGGTIRDYHGYGRARRPLLPMIGIPTTAGTGSDAQSYAVISDADTHVKMTCGDPTAAFRVALLDPLLTVSQPPAVTAAAGYDAVSHVVESWVTTRRTALSDLFAREAWALVGPGFRRVLDEPADLDARGAMQVGAFLAGLAIEHSMLGATHACANPLTARFGVTHGVAIAMLLPHVVRWNASAAGARYLDLLRLAAIDVDGRSPAEGAARLADHLAAMAAGAGFPPALRDAGVPRTDLARLADDAAGQWTGRFNPRPFDRDGALEIYTWAY